MADSVERVANAAMNFYYQQFRPADGFLRLEHFIFLCIAADAKLKQDEYKEQVNILLRTRRFNAQVTLSSDNYQTVEAEIKESKAQLPDPIMMFSGAPSNLGVSVVKPEGNCIAIPIKEDERWQVEKITDVIFWLPSSCGNIEFINLKGRCNPKKVKVIYIPQYQEKNAASSTLQESRKFTIINMVISFIKAAKEGVIIDVSNDGNPNVALQTEINKYLLQNK